MTFHSPPKIFDPEQKAFKALKYFTICLPSHRPLSTSKSSIDSAIDFVGKTGGSLIVSDNSGDPQKLAHYKTVPEHVLYLEAPGISGLDNLLNCLAQVKTEFILPMGDDDFIRTAPQLSRFDFSTLDKHFVGVKPMTEIFNEELGIFPIGIFSIDDASPLERMRTYCDKSNGNNASYYSYYRTSCFDGLYRLMADHHPTKGGYTDWAMVLSLMAMGQMAEDPSTVFSYNVVNWGNAESIDESRRTLFRNAQLPAGAEKFESLFNFLDCCGFVSCKASPLTLVEKANARNGAALLYIRQFLDDVDRNPSDYADQSSLIEALRKETFAEDTSPESMIPYALMIWQRLMHRVWPSPWAVDAPKLS